MNSQAHCLVAQKSFTRPKPAKELAFPTRREEEEKHETLTRGISHGWVRADSTSRISSQPQFRSDTQTLV